MKRSLNPFTFFISLLAATVVTVSAEDAWPGEWATVSEWSGLWSPQGIAVDTAGNVYATSYQNHTVVKIPAGSATGSSLGVPNGYDFSSFAPSAVALDGAGDVYVINRMGVTDAVIWKYTTATSTWADITYGCQLRAPTGIAVAGNGNVYITDAQSASFPDNQKILMLAKNTTTWILIANHDHINGPAAYMLHNPAGMATGSDGLVYFVNRNPQSGFYPSTTYIAKISAANTFDNVAAIQDYLFTDIALNATGDFYVTGAEVQNHVFCVRHNAGSSDWWRISDKRGGGANLFNQPRGIATDAAGAVYVTDLRDAIGAIVKHPGWLAPQMVWTAYPGDTFVNQTLSPAPSVEVRNTAGFVQTTVAGTVFIAGGNVAGTLSKSLVNGAAIFADLTMPIAGNHVLTASISIPNPLLEYHTFLTPLIPAPPTVVFQSGALFAVKNDTFHITSITFDDSGRVVIGYSPAGDCAVSVSFDLADPDGWREYPDATTDTHDGFLRVTMSAITNDAPRVFFKLKGK